jgi:hypothetical protein
MDKVNRDLVFNRIRILIFIKLQNSSHIKHDSQLFLYQLKE